MKSKIVPVSIQAALAASDGVPLEVLIALSAAPGAKARRTRAIPVSTADESNATGVSVEVSIAPRVEPTPVA